MALNSYSTQTAHQAQETHTKTNKRYVVLNDGSFAEVPEGADADFIRQTKNRALANKASGAKRTSRTSRSQNSRRTNYAAQVLQRNSAMAELVVRVNEPTPDPTMDDNLIIIHTAGYTAYMSREDWKVTYA